MNTGAAVKAMVDGLIGECDGDRYRWHICLFETWYMGWDSVKRLPISDQWTLERPPVTFGGQSIEESEATAT